MEKKGMTVFVIIKSLEIYKLKYAPFVIFNK